MIIVGNYAEDVSSIPHSVMGMELRLKTQGNFTTNHTECVTTCIFHGHEALLFSHKQMYRLLNVYTKMARLRVYMNDIYLDLGKSICVSLYTEFLLINLVCKRRNKMIAIRYHASVCCMHVTPEMLHISFLCMPVQS